MLLWFQCVALWKWKHCLLEFNHPVKVHEDQWTVSGHLRMTQIFKNDFKIAFNHRSACFSCSVPTGAPLSTLIPWICSTDGRPGATEVRWAWLSHPGPAVYRPDRFQWSPRVLLLPEPIGPWKLCKEVLQPGQPLPNAAGQHRLWGLRTGRVLRGQLQTGDWNQVRITGFFYHTGVAVFSAMFKRFWRVLLPCHIKVLHTFSYQLCAS